MNLLQIGKQLAQIERIKTDLMLRPERKSFNSVGKVRSHCRAIGQDHRPHTRWSTNHRRFSPRVANWRFPHPLSGRSETSHCSSLPEAISPPPTGSRLPATFSFNTCCTVARASSDLARPSSASTGALLDQCGASAIHLDKGDKVLERALEYCPHRRRIHR